MKFKCQVEIDRPIEQVIELFDNAENMKYWQDGFIRFEHLSGRAGEVGAKSTIYYKMGKKEFTLVETITKKNLPYEFDGKYEHQHMDNTMKNRFKKLGFNKTRWEADLEYTEIRNFLMKTIAFIYPAMFKKQTQKWMDQFKVFAEKS